MDKNIVALLREDVKTVRVVFPVDSHQRRYQATHQGAFLDSLGSTERAEYMDDIKAGVKKEYTYITNLPVRAGEAVIVKVAGNLKVATVTGVDERAEIEPNSQTEYKWLVCRIDLTEYQVQQKKNAKIQEVVTDAYKNNLRKSFAQQILSGVDDDKRLELQNLLK